MEGRLVGKLGYVMGYEEGRGDGMEWVRLVGVCRKEVVRDDDDDVYGYNAHITPDMHIHIVLDLNRS